MMAADIRESGAIVLNLRMKTVGGRAMGRLVWGV